MIPVLQQGAATHQVRGFDVFLVQCKLFHKLIGCSAYICSYWTNVCNGAAIHTTIYYDDTLTWLNPHISDSL